MNGNNETASDFAFLECSGPVSSSSNTYKKNKDNKDKDKDKKNPADSLYHEFNQLKVVLPSIPNTQVRMK